MKSFFASFLVIIGTIIGAGFASGREILNFFNIYEKKGFISICISSAIFGLAIILVSFVVKKYKIKDYKELISKNKILTFVLPIFSFTCFSIMISGVGAFFEEYLNINFWLGSGIATSICYTIFLHDFKGIEVINIFLVPIILIGIFILGFYNYEKIGITLELKSFYISSSFTGNFVVSAILYASYNLLILVPILVNFEKYNLSNKKILLIGVLTFITLGILIFLIYRVNNKFYPNIMAYELPNMKIASLISKKMQIFYGIVVLCAIFTTAISAGFSFLKMKHKENYEKNAFIMCVVAFLCAKLGFSNMINICFPLFGYLGIFQIILILIKLKNGVGSK